MRIPRIYLPIPLQVGATVPLDDNGVGHVVRVLRLQPGAALILFDGNGHAFMASLIDISKRAAWAQVLEVLTTDLTVPLPIVLIQGISRGDKMDYTVQKVVELGVSAIQPVFTERGGVDLTAERLRRKLDHWQRIIISACEQCGQNQLPKLYPPLPLATWLAQSTPLGLRLVLDPAAAQGLRAFAAPTTALTVLVGPEGGLSTAEIAVAHQYAFMGVRLGPRILRTETAGLAALAAIQALWGDWN
jgi:16S rRNA (uracil1498-N3)-methyltransferase